MAQRTTLKEFEAVFPKLEADLVEHAESYKLPQKQIDWYKAVGAPARICHDHGHHLVSETPSSLINPVA